MHDMMLRIIFLKNIIICHLAVGTGVALTSDCLGHVYNLDNTKVIINRYLLLILHQCR